MRGVLELAANCSKFPISLFSSSKTDSGVAMVCLEAMGAETTEAATTGMLETDEATVLVVARAPAGATTGVVIVVVTFAGAIETGVVVGAIGQPLGKRATATPWWIYGEYKTTRNKK